MSIYVEIQTIVNKLTTAYKKSNIRHAIDTGKQNMQMDTLYRICFAEI